MKIAMNSNDSYYEDIIYNTFITHFKEELNQLLYEN